MHLYLNAQCSVLSARCSMKSSMLIFIQLLFLFGTISQAQPEFPPNAPVFDSSVVARVDITVNPDTLTWLYENVESDIEFHATFRFSNGTIDSTVNNIGFRLRGNTSRYSAKKSFKVSFNTYEPGRKFFGMEKMNLNGEHNDPSIIRSGLCWEWLRKMDVPAPRATHAEVYINGNYFGLYMIVEHVDEEFMESRFGNKNGNMFMCLWPADLAYLGSNPDLYKLTSYGRPVYELKTNEMYNNYSDLAHFIDVLNNTPLNNLECELEKVFNLNDYLKVMALDVMTGNWDGYIYNKNNFYLYHNTKTGRFEYIPYDLDNTLGIDWLDGDWGNRNIYSWAPGGSEVRPLYSRLLSVPAIRDRYSFYFKQLLDILSNEDSVFTAIDHIRDMIAPSVADDPYYPLDYGFTYNDFLNSYSQALGGHVDYGLKNFIQTRKASALQQLDLVNIPPAVNHFATARAKPGEQYWVRAFVTDEDASPEVKLKYQINGGVVVFKNMKDDGTHHDLEIDDHFYGCEFDSFDIGQTISWQVQATDDNGQVTLLPCDPVVISFHASADPQLFINELIGDNDTTIADEYGGYDNWLEIYNADSQPVWLGDKYLSDNLDDPNKWDLPDVTMGPGEFLLIWADGEPDQGPFHANFKLNDEGEELGIFDNETTGYFLIDSVSWGMQTIDISYGREHDGQFPWVFFTHPTPGYSNGTYGIDDNKDDEDNFYFYPNPVNNGAIYFRHPFTGSLLDLTGKTVWSGENVMTISTAGIVNGLYLLKEENGMTKKLIINF